MKEPGTILEQFGRFEQQTKQPSWVYPLRKAGMARFADSGFPTTLMEDWRFTNVAAIAKLPFKPTWESQNQGVTRETVAQLAFGSLDAHRLVFVDGHFAPEFSSPVSDQDGLTAISLSRALKEQPQLLEKHLSRYASIDQESSFTALNTAFFQDGAFIHVKAGSQVAKPVHLLYLTTTGESGATTQLRNLIIVEAGSQTCVLENYASLTDSAYFTNAVTELVAGDNAKLEHVKFQDESLSAYHMAGINGVLGRNSNVILHSIATGAKISRNSIRTKLEGEGLECILNGLYLTKKDQLADHHMVVEHAAPHCNSHEYYNGILDGKSKGVFHGRILVRKIAQKTDAKQTNKNLLLSDDATADTKPQLEIYADDVKCTHGATVGQLNEESIFYLRTRGLSLKTARRMLIHAFAGEIIERIRNPLAREELDKVVWDRLEANPRLNEID